MDKDKRLIWVDMEMTGLDPDSDRVIEIATILTYWLRGQSLLYIRAMTCSPKWMSGTRERTRIQGWSIVSEPAQWMRPRRHKKLCGFSMIG